MTRQQERDLADELAGIYPKPLQGQGYSNVLVSNTTTPATYTSLGAIK